MRWHALTVHARSEARATAAIARLVGEVYLPVSRVHRLWSDRTQAHDAPLFPGYVFIRARLDAALRVELLRTRLVVDVVGRLPGDPRIARCIPDAQVAAMRAMVATARALEVTTPAIGKRVCIARGALRGVEGVVVVAGDGQRQISVSISLLGRDIRVPISADDVLGVETHCVSRSA